MLNLTRIDLSLEFRSMMVLLPRFGLITGTQAALCRFPSLPCFPILLGLMYLCSLFSRMVLISAYGLG